jgi:hypothetical protein
MKKYYKQFKKLIIKKSKRVGFWGLQSVRWAVWVSWAL